VGCDDYGDTTSGTGAPGYAEALARNALQPVVKLEPAVPSYMKPRWWNVKAWLSIWSMQRHLRPWNEQRHGC
jgi:hypothetical protein